MTRRNPWRTATRLCATCGTPFTWTSRNPRRRFCQPGCKARWWRAANTTTTPDPVDRATSATATASTSTGQTTQGPTQPAGTANAVTQPYDPYVAGYRTEQTPTTVQSCPNCHQPIAVINLLVTPAAAYVNTPSRAVTPVS
jgi:endogenous inhibitor of DNA gyrase (YacG/DUF329 family)